MKEEKATIKGIIYEILEDAVVVELHLGNNGQYKELREFDKIHLKTLQLEVGNNFYMDCSVKQGCLGYIFRTDMPNKDYEYNPYSRVTTRYYCRLVEVTERLTTVEAKISLESDIFYISTHKGLLEGLIPLKQNQCLIIDTVIGDNSIEYLAYPDDGTVDSYYPEIDYSEGLGDTYFFSNN